LTRLFNEKFHEADVLEADVVCGIRYADTVPGPEFIAKLQAKEGTYRKRIKDLQGLIGPTPERPLPKPLDYIVRLIGLLPFLHTDEPSESSPSLSEDKKMGLLGQEMDNVPPSSRGLQDQDVTEKEGKISEAVSTEVAGPIMPVEPSPSEASRAQKEGEDALVTIHQAHPTWDDTPNYDLPYENPYYTRSIDNFLWLPSDPFGTLDLDDTVDLHRAITLEAGESSNIGAWSQRFPPIRVNASGSRASSVTGDVKGSGKDLLQPRGVDGESTTLPEAADRDTEHRRHSSVGSTRRPTLDRKHSSKPEVAVPVVPAEVNDQIQDQLELGRVESHEYVSVRAPSPAPQRRSTSRDDALQQRDAVSPSASQREAHRRPPSHLSQNLEEGDQPPPAVNIGISMQHAIRDDVLAEEEIEAKQRQEREDEDEKKAQPRRRRRFFSWIWRGTAF
jgi:hypothetical protein